MNERYAERQPKTKMYGMRKRKSVRVEIVYIAIMQETKKGKRTTTRKQQSHNSRLIFKLAHRNGLGSLETAHRTVLVHDDIPKHARALGLVQQIDDRARVTRQTTQVDVHALARRHVDFKHPRRDRRAFQLEALLARGLHERHERVPDLSVFVHRVAALVWELRVHVGHG